MITLLHKSLAFLEAFRLPLSFFKNRFILMLGLSFLSLAQLCIPFLIESSIRIIERSPWEPTWFFLVGAAMTIILGVTNHADRLYLEKAHHCVIDMSVTLSACIFEKIDLSNHQQLGRKQNLMFADAESYGEALPVLVDLAKALLMLCGAFLVLAHYLGLGVLLPLFCLLSLVPLQMILGQRLSALNFLLARREDQLLGQIQAYSSSEDNVDRSSIFRSKKLESKQRRQGAKWDSLSFLLNRGSSVALSLGAFSFLWWTGQLNDVSVVFACMAAFGLIDRSFGVFAQKIKHLSRIQASFRRLRPFLKDPLSRCAWQKTASKRNPRIKRNLELGLACNSAFLASKTFVQGLGHQGVRSLFAMLLLSVALVMTPIVAQYLLSYAALAEGFQSKTFLNYWVLTLLNLLLLFAKDLSCLLLAQRSGWSLFKNHFPFEMTRAPKLPSLTTSFTRDWEHVIHMWGVTLPAIVQSLLTFLFGFIVLCFLCPPYLPIYVLSLFFFSKLWAQHRTFLLENRKRFYQARDMRWKLLHQKTKVPQSLSNGVLFYWARRLDGLNRCIYQFYNGSHLGLCVMLIGVFASVAYFYEASSMLSIYWGLLLNLILQSWGSAQSLARQMLALESKASSLDRIIAWKPVGELRRV